MRIIYNYNKRGVKYMKNLSSESIKTKARKSHSLIYNYKKKEEEYQKENVFCTPYIYRCI